MVSRERQCPQQSLRVVSFLAYAPDPEVKNTALEPSRGSKTGSYNKGKRLPQKLPFVSLLSRVFHCQSKASTVPRVTNSQCTRGFNIIYFAVYLPRGSHHAGWCAEVLVAYRNRVNREAVSLVRHPVSRRNTNSVYGCTQEGHFARF